MTNRREGGNCLLAGEIEVITDWWRSNYGLIGRREGGKYRGIERLLPTARRERGNRRLTGGGEVTTDLPERERELLESPEEGGMEGRCLGKVAVPVRIFLGLFVRVLFAPGVRSWSTRFVAFAADGVHALFWYGRIGRAGVGEGEGSKGGRAGLRQRWEEGVWGGGGGGTRCGVGGRTQCVFPRVLSFLDDEV